MPSNPASSLDLSTQSDAVNMYGYNRAPSGALDQHGSSGGGGNNVAHCGNAVSVIKGEIHNVLSVMRPTYASPLRFRMEVLVPNSAHKNAKGRGKVQRSGSTRSVELGGSAAPGVATYEHHPLLSSFHSLNDRLSHMSINSPQYARSNVLDNLDVTVYIAPFATTISSPELSAAITGAALSSLTKFLLYGFVTETSPRAHEGVTLIARCLRYCSFEDSGNDGDKGRINRHAAAHLHHHHEASLTPSKSATSPAGGYSWWSSGRGKADEKSATATTASAGEANDEEVVLKLLSLSALLVRNPAAATLRSDDVVGLFDLCLYVARQVDGASALLRSAAGDALAHIVLVVFGRGAAEAEQAGGGGSPAAATPANGTDDARGSDSATRTDNVGDTGSSNAPRIPSAGASSSPSGGKGPGLFRKGARSHGGDAEDEEKRRLLADDTASESIPAWPSFSSSASASSGDDDEPGEEGEGGNDRISAEKNGEAKARNGGGGEGDASDETRLATPGGATTTVEASEASGAADDSGPVTGGAKSSSPPPLQTQQQQSSTRPQSQPAVEEGEVHALVTILHRLSHLADPLAVPNCVQLALSLINIALETMSTRLNSYPAVIPILQNTLCKHLLRLGGTTHDPQIFSLTLRVIFNLFNCIRNHMKIQLEVFLTSVHLRVVNNPIHVEPVLQELALESLVEFCREPLLMMDLYYNYDCDVHCSNLFEILCRALATAASPPPVEDWGITGPILTSGSTRVSVVGGNAVPVGPGPPAFGSPPTSPPMSPVSSPRSTRKVVISTLPGGDGASVATAATTDAASVLSGGGGGGRAQITHHAPNALNRLALEGILAVIDSIARRCDTASGGGGGGRATSSTEAMTSGPPTPQASFCEGGAGSGPPSGQGPAGQQQHLLLLDPRVLQRRKQRKRCLALAAAEFNKKPLSNEWVHYASTLGVFGEDCRKTNSPSAGSKPSAAAIARFLYDTPNLNKTQMGLYLSRGPREKYPFHAEVLEEFANLFDFERKADGAGGGAADAASSAPPSGQHHQLRQELSPEEGGAGGNLTREASVASSIGAVDGTIPVLGEGGSGATPMDFSEALRTFLSKFRLPGEAQCIDRLMEAFARRLYEVECSHASQGLGESHCNGGAIVTSDSSAGNEQTDGENAGTDEKNNRNNDGGRVGQTLPSPSSIFKNSDSIFILAFSTIMLNTDLHNPTIADERRMTEEQFVRNNRGINDGDDLPEEYLRDLYAKIKADEIQVQQELTDVMSNAGGGIGTSNGDIVKWDGLLSSKSGQIATPFFSKSNHWGSTADDAHLGGSSTALFQQAAGVHERDMFTSIAASTLQCIRTIFVRSWDDALVVKALQGFQQMAHVSVYFGMNDLFNEIVVTLLGYGMDYISSVAHGTLPYDASDDQDEDEYSYLTDEDNDDDDDDNDRGIDDGSADGHAPFPHALLQYTATTAAVHATHWGDDSLDICGSAAHRGLLSLHCAFTLLRTRMSHVLDGTWPVLVECLYALRDVDALPVGLAELDDFGDRRGVQFPPSLFARQSRARVECYMESILAPEEDTSKGFWGSVTSLLPFSGSSGNGTKHSTSAKIVQSGDGRSEDHDESAVVGTHDLIQSSFASPFSDALLSVAEAAQLDQVIMRSKDEKLSTQVIGALLDAIDLPEESSLIGHTSSPSLDPLFEHHAVLALELAARALLSNRQRAPKLFTMFQPKLESILRRPEVHQHETTANDAIKMPYLMERAMVTILRSCVHLFDIPMMRPHLVSSLHLLERLPLTFVRHVSDRLACGMAIILLGSYTQLESEQEWDLIHNLLNMAAQCNPGRGFVFDGIASCVEQVFPDLSLDAQPALLDTGDGVRISTRGAAVLTDILVKFVSGAYEGDVSARPVAMPCLEKAFSYMSLVSAKDTVLSPDGEVRANSFVSSGGWEVLWSNVSSAFYSACLSTDADVARQGNDCVQRIVLTTKIEEISDIGWLLLLDNMIAKQPPLDAELSRISTCDLLGKILLMTIPELSQRKKNWDRLTEIVHRTAAVMGENLQAGRRNGHMSILFESTVQLVTNVSNVMFLSDFDKGIGFGQFVGETLLIELEKVGAGGGSAKMIAATTKCGDEAPEVEPRENGNEAYVS